MSKQNLLVVGLLVSLSINLLIAGIVIGRAGRPGPPVPPPANWVADQLDTQTRQAVRKRMAQQAPMVRPIREDLRKAMANLRRVASAEEYDAQAMAEALARVREVRGRYEAFIHGNLAEVSAELSRPQRAALLRAALQRGMDGPRPTGSTERKMPPRSGG